MTFPVENIPLTDKLFRRIPPHQCNKRGKISSSAFEDFDTSVDWEKYSTPEETLNRLPPGKNKTGWKVASILASIPVEFGQSVVHAPLESPANQAHSLIRGEKTLQVSDDLAKLSPIGFPPPA